MHADDWNDYGRCGFKKGFFVRKKLAGLCREVAVLSGFDDTGFMDFKSHSDHSFCERCAAHFVSGNRGSSGSYGNPDGKFVS